MLVTIRPVTVRENQIAHNLGADGWELLEEREHVICFGGGRGFIVKKNGHIRWVHAITKT